MTGRDDELPPDHVDVGAYCRHVEDHLARVNSGHLIRIVGPGFELVRGWALAGIPVSIVCHGISLKAERHHAGKSRRPLRLEFCETDVRAAYDHWRRAVGLFDRPIDLDPAEAGVPEPRKRASLTKHLDRAVERLSHVAGRMDLPSTFRDQVSGVLQALTRHADDARHTRGAARDEILTQLTALDAQLLGYAREAIGAADLARLRDDAREELASYQSRLEPAAWARSIELGIDRLLRERLKLPSIAP